MLTVVLPCWLLWESRADWRALGVFLHNKVPLGFVNCRVLRQPMLITISTTSAIMSRWGP